MLSLQAVSGLVYYWDMIDERKYVFIAGGIGITPFRSMIMDLMEKNERRDIVLLYKAGTDDELLFRNIFSRAEQIGLQTVYFSSQQITAESIKKHAPIWQSRIYYISGPHGFVEEKRQMLETLGIPQDQIKTDLFTGYEE